MNPISDEMQENLRTEGVESVMFIRCIGHRAVAQMNTLANGEAECAVCATEGLRKELREKEEMIEKRRKCCVYCGEPILYFVETAQLDENRNAHGKCYDEQWKMKQEVQRLQASCAAKTECLQGTVKRLNEAIMEWSWERIHIIRNDLMSADTSGSELLERVRKAEAKLTETNAFYEKETKRLIDAYLIEIDRLKKVTSGFIEEEAAKRATQYRIENETLKQRVAELEAEASARKTNKELGLDF